MKFGYSRLTPKNNYGNAKGIFHCFIIEKNLRPSPVLCHAPTTYYDRGHYEGAASEEILILTYLCLSTTLILSSLRVSFSLSADSVMLIAILLEHLHRLFIEMLLRPMLNDASRSRYSLSCSVALSRSR